MKNVYMEKYTKRLVKGVLLGVAFALIILISPLIMKENPLAALPGYLVPVVCIVAVFYGTGWYFGFALVKWFIRKALRINRNASIKQAIAGKGAVAGIIIALFCFVIGCVISFVVGNFFMVADYLAAKKGKPAVSEKYEFETHCDDSEEDIRAIEDAVKNNEIENGVSADIRSKNADNLDSIARGEGGTITAVVEENGEKKVRETTIH